MVELLPLKVYPLTLIFIDSASTGEFSGKEEVSCDCGELGSLKSIS